MDLPPTDFNGPNTFFPTCRRKTNAGNVFTSEAEAELKAYHLRIRRADVRAFACAVCGLWHVGKPPPPLRAPNKDLKKELRSARQESLRRRRQYRHSKSARRRKPKQEN